MTCAINAVLVVGGLMVGWYLRECWYRISIRGMKDLLVYWKVQCADCHKPGALIDLTEKLSEATGPLN